MYPPRINSDPNDPAGLYQWRDHYQAQPRRNAISNGLRYIYHFAEQPKTFDLKSIESIVAIYDVAAIAKESSRIVALNFIHNLVHKWISEFELTTLTHSEDLMNTVVSMYCMEKIGLSWNRQEEMRQRIEHSTSTAVDIHGWDPKLGPPPCSKEKNPYRMLSNCLVRCYYAEKVNAKCHLGCSYAEAFQWISHFQPYRSPLSLEKDQYIEQCYLVFYVVLTLSNWGQRRLDAKLFPHEFEFACQSIQVHIAQKNIHLVAAYVQILKLFCGDDRDERIIKGIDFILKHQDSEGKWQDMDMDKQSMISSSFSTTYLAIQALLIHQPLPIGIGIDSVIPKLMEIRDEKEKENANLSDGIFCLDHRKSRMIRCAQLMNAALAIAEKQAIARDAVQIKQIQNMKVLFIQDPLQSTVPLNTINTEQMKVDLTTLATMKISYKVLKDTGVGKIVNKLRKHPSEHVVTLAKELVAKWKKEYF